MFIGGMPGARVDPDHVLGPATRKAKRRLLNCCKDGLGLNGLLAGQLQRASVASKDKNDEFHAFNQDCVAHQAALAMRPALV